MKKINWLSSLMALSLLFSSSAYAEGDDLFSHLWGGAKSFFYSACTAAGASFGWEGGKGLYRWTKEHKLAVGIGVGVVITLAVLKKLYDEQEKSKKNNESGYKYHSDVL